MPARPSLLNVPGAPRVVRRDRPSRPGIVERVSPDGAAVTVFWVSTGTRSVCDPKALRPERRGA